MADVMEAFTRGRAQAGAEQEHTVALAESKLRQQVLKHQLDSLKLEDQIRAHDLIKGRADLGLGQGDPDEDLSKPAATLPPSAMGALKTAMLNRTLEGQPVPGDAQQPAAPAQAQPQAPPGRIVGPADGSTGVPPMVLHQDDTLPATHADLAQGATPGAPGDAAHPAMKSAGHVWLPPLKVPELGIDVPGMWYSAKAAAAEQSARAIELKRAELPLHNVGPEDTAIDQATGRVVYTNPNSRGNTPQEKYIAALQKGDVEGAKTILQGIRDTQRPGARTLETMLLDARTKGDKVQADLIKSVMGEVAGARRDPDVADERAFTRRRQLYTEDVSNGWRKQADDLKKWTAEYPAGKIDDTVPDPPEFTPPSFSEWQKTHGEDITAADTARRGRTAAPVTGKAPDTSKLSDTQKADFLRLTKGVDPNNTTELNRLYDVVKQAPATKDETGALPADTAVGDFVMQGGKRYQVKELKGGNVSLTPAQGEVQAGQIVHYKGGRYKVASITNGQAKLEPATKK